MSVCAEKTVLITGGASGVGRAMAEAFDAAGATVWVVDASREALDTCPDHWGRACFDVADEAKVRRLFERHLPEGVDILCANAGTAGPTSPVTDISLEEWRTCIAVNLDAVFLFAKYAAPTMTAKGAGSIIITSSTAGLHGYPNRAPYCASKWAVIGLAKTLAMELGPSGVRANAICPGSVNGPRMDGVIEREAAERGMSADDVRAGYVKGVSLRSFVDAEDIANMAVFLASDAGKRISGQALSVDGHIFNPDAG